MSPATTNSAATALPGTSRLIRVASQQYPRYSEGDLLKLTDGRLLLAVARKNGGSDFARGQIIGLFSLDAGVSWDDEPHIIQSPWADMTDVMSVSLFRTARGIHLFFLARGKDATRDTQVYQILSADEAQSWSKPTRVSLRDGYHIANNARVIRTVTGRMVIPCAFVEGDISKIFDSQKIFCLYSDDDALTWHESSTLTLPGSPLMEPGIAECADGSVYMTIRTKKGELYQSRSTDNAATWSPPEPTGLPAPEAPSTVFRDPSSNDLWLFWCDHSKASWKGRSRIVFASSKDHGKTWGPRRPIEDDPRHSYGYTSVDLIGRHVLLTYYDWPDHGQPPFAITSLRQRTILLDWFHDHPTPPIFTKRDTPVLTADGTITSLNSGLVIDPDRWRIWYTRGHLGPAGERLTIRCAQSTDQGLTWTDTDPQPVFPKQGDPANWYPASIHRLGQNLIAHLRHDNVLQRYISTDNGHTFTRDANAATNEAAGDGRISNDAFDILLNPDGSWECFAAHIEKATDPRTVITRATSPNGLRFSATEVVLRPDTDDAADIQFYYLQVIRYRGFYLGLLYTRHVAAQTIQPEFAWSHNGHNWSRTRTPAISLGDEGAFDSRMIIFGSLALTPTHLVYLYTAFKKPNLFSAIGRATLPFTTLDAWLATLPQP